MLLNILYIFKAARTHLYLKMDTKTQKSQLSGLVKNPELFTANGFMRYVGTSAIFDPKDPNGISHHSMSRWLRSLLGLFRKTKSMHMNGCFTQSRSLKCLLGYTCLRRISCHPKMNLYRMKWRTGCLKN